jgi:hypothetical protein
VDVSGFKFQALMGNKKSHDAKAHRGLTGRRIRLLPVHGRASRWVEFFGSKQSLLVHEARSFLCEIDLRVEFTGWREECQVVKAIL